MRNYRQRLGDRIRSRTHLAVQLPRRVTVIGRVDGPSAESPDVNDDRGGKSVASRDSVVTVFIEASVGSLAALTHRHCGQLCHPDPRFRDVANRAGAEPYGSCPRYRRLWVTGGAPDPSTGAVPARAAGWVVPASFGARWPGKISTGFSMAVGTDL